MKALTTHNGERIVMDDDTADFLLGPQGEALLRRKAEADDRAAHFREEEERAALAAECAFEIRAREREDDEETLAEIRLHHRMEQWRERRDLEAE